MASASYSEVSSSIGSGLQTSSLVPSTPAISSTPSNPIAHSASVILATLANTHLSTTIAPVPTSKPTTASIPTVEPRPTTTSIPPEPAISPDIDNPTSPTHSPTFKLVLDSGKCTSLGVPTLIDHSNDFSTYELTPLGEHQYTVSLTAKSEQDQAVTFLTDHGVRCRALGSCVYIEMSYGADGMKIRILRVRRNMYPFSIWMDGGRQPNGAPADSQTRQYNCWGWSQSECPFMLMDLTETYAVSTSVPGATVHITFCPDDGPDASSAGPSNTNVPHRTPRITLGVIETETFTPVSTFLLPLTGLPEPRASLLHGSISPIVTIPVPTILTDSVGRAILTSTVSAAVLPTWSTVSDSRGSAIGTASYNLTTSISPSPTSPIGTVFSTTSWTTYMTVDGSTVPAIGGQVGILTAISETYVFEQSTMIPLKVYSSIRAESTHSTQTSLPSSLTSSSPHVPSTWRTTVIIAVIGPLVGITLVSVFIWVVLVKRRKRESRTSDYAECQPSMWGPRSMLGSNSRGDSTLDLDSGPGPRASFIEPWAGYNQIPSTSRKIRGEMEERQGESIVASPSGGVAAANSSREHAYSSLRPSKSPNRVQPELRLEPPARGDPSFVRLPQESVDSSPPAATTRPILQYAPPRMPLPLQPHAPVAQSRDEDAVARSTAIPPMYNEAWNIRRDPGE
ncbi:hypothetical protein RhiJN_26323 [Ceratobasidium sp. AG-Ba]|nr:hypothetical protein RhiJN_26323 [Ceratobasidium sp. AG-Ba]